MSLGVIDQPIQMLQTDFAVYVGIVYSYLPFMILPLYANLEKHGPDAARGRGRPRLQALAGASCKITLPLSMPGIIAGCMLVFIPAVGEFVIPSLLGGPGMLMIGKVLWTEFFNNRDWPVASAVAIALLLFLVIPIMFFQRAQDAEAGEGCTDEPRPSPGSARSSLILGFAFLYIPIVLADRLLVQQVAAGHGLGRLLDQVVRRAAAATSRSWTPPGSACKIAAISATLAVVLGTLAGLVLARFGPFQGRTLLSGMTTAPLVMPEVITGLSLLLLFVDDGAAASAGRRAAA